MDRKEAIAKLKSIQETTEDQRWALAAEYAIAALTTGPTPQEVARLLPEWAAGMVWCPQVKLWALVDKKPIPLNDIWEHKGRWQYLALNLPYTGDWRESWTPRVPEELLGEWQACPVCVGQGKVPYPPHARGCEQFSTNETGPWDCSRCKGTGTIERPQVSAPEVCKWTQNEYDGYHSTCGLECKYMPTEETPICPRCKGEIKVTTERDAEIQRLKDALAAQANLSHLLDRLLVCYRIGKNPGDLLDAISDARRKAEETERAALAEPKEPTP